MAMLRTISPVDGSVFVERTLAGDAEVEAALARSVTAQRDWKRRPLTERAGLLSAFVDRFVARRDEIALELTWQMGRPIRYTPGEVRGFEERARTMIALAPQALADIDAGPKQGFRRFIRREPVGVVLVVAPWNYPYLTAVNSVVPALMAGNSVLLKHAQQTPLCAERMVEAGKAAGLPDGLLQSIHTSHEMTARLIRHDGIAHVAFTGAVRAHLASDPRVVDPRKYLAPARDEVAAVVTRIIAALAALSASGSSSAARTRRMSAPTPIWITRSRIWSMERSSTPGNRAAASSAFTSMRGFTTASSTMPSS